MEGYLYTHSVVGKYLLQGISIKRVRKAGGHTKVILDVVAGTRCTSPVFVTTFSGGSLIVKVGGGADVIIVDEVVGSRRSYDREVNVFVGSGARVMMMCLVHPSERSRVRYMQRGQIDVGGKLHWWNAVTGGGCIEQEVISEVVGEGGESVMDCVFHSCKDQRYSLRLRNIFQAHYGSGEVTVKGVVEGRAHAVCHGRIVIGIEGCGTQTHLNQHVLMLDATAQVDAVPALEIKTNDVRASHSATVTKIADEDLFYCASRGIGCHEARRMLVEGFLGELFGRIEHRDLREVLEQALQKSLKRKNHV